MVLRIRRNAETVVFHTGTALRVGKLYLLEDRTLEAGGKAAATVAVAQLAGQATASESALGTVTIAVPAAKWQYSANPPLRGCSATIRS